MGGERGHRGNRTSRSCRAAPTARPASATIHRCTAPQATKGPPATRAANARPPPHSPATHSPNPLKPDLSCGLIDGAARQQAQTTHPRTAPRNRHTQIGQNQPHQHSLSQKNANQSNHYPGHHDYTSPEREFSAGMGGNGNGRPGSPSMLVSTNSFFSKYCPSDASSSLEKRLACRSRSTS